MKKKLFRLSLLLLCLLMLSACTPKMVYQDGLYVNEKNNIAYRAAPGNYQAIAYLPDKQAKINQKKIDDIVLYSIDGMDGQKWLCTEEHSVFYAEGEHLPALWEMEVSTIYVNRTVNISYIMHTIADPEAIQGLVELYRAGNFCDASKIDPNLNFDSYDLVFEGKHLRFCLTYRQYREDVKISEEIADPNNFSVLYPGVPVTVESDTGKDGRVIYYAVYNFGRSIIYDRYTKQILWSGGYLDGLLSEE